MENNEFEFEIITPINIFFKERVQSIIVNTPNGKIGIQSLHEPLIAAIEEGKLEVRIGEEWKEFFVAKGFMEVQTDSVFVFTDEVTNFTNKQESILNSIKQNKYEEQQRKKTKIEHTQMESFINRAINNLKYDKEIKK